MMKNFFKSRVLSNAIALSRKEGLGPFRNGVVSLRKLGPLCGHRELRSHFPALTLAQAVRSTCPHLAPTCTT